MASDRIVTLTTPLGPDELLFMHLKGFDMLSACFRFDLRLESENPDIAAEKLLGEAVTVMVETEKDEAKRYFSGLVDEFYFDGDADAGGYVYRLVLRPKFWTLSKAMDNRIFQQMTVPEIVQEVLDKAGVTDYRLDIDGSYPAREYCVQYGETNLDFVQRLLEHEGIIYYFEYGDGTHTMVLCDHQNQFLASDPVFELPFEAAGVQRTGDMEVLTRLMDAAHVVTAKHVHTDYDFEKPSADLMAQTEMGGAHLDDDKERYFYPGKYVEHGRGQDLSDIRIDEQRARRRMILAQSTSVFPFSGSFFKITESPREEHNIEVFVHRAEYDLREANYAAGGSTASSEQEGQEGFWASYELIAMDAHYRPGRTTPKPVMKGPQTAVVVGPAGEEIHTDEYSRVKVQFHWDRLGGKDENSTCFIRVSSTWAGSGWGFIQIPRIGQEVIVDFLEGDPDAPIVTGRVYNAEQMPPYGLPGNATQSGWKSNSSPGGGGWNELRFEDKKGQEEVYFQAEKDHNELVKNDESRTIGHDFAEDVGNDATQSVGHDRTESVGNNKSTSVGVDRTVSIGSNDTETVGSNRSLTVGANETINIGANSTETIGANHTQSVAVAQTITVGAARVDTVGAAENRTVGAAQNNIIGGARVVTVGDSQTHTVASDDTVTIGADQSTTIAAKHALTVGSDQSIEIGGAHGEKVAKGSSLEIGEGMLVKVGTDLVIEAGDSIVIKVGKAAISMKKDGTVNIEGKDITTKGSGAINVKASKDITMKGSKINQN